MFQSRTQRRKKKLTKGKVKKAEELSGSQLARAFRRFRKNKSGLLGLLLTLFLFAGYSCWHEIPRNSWMQGLC